MNIYKKRIAAVLSVTLVVGTTLAGCSSSPAITVDRDFGVPVAGEVKPGILSGVTLAYAASGGIFQESQAEAAFDPFAKDSGASVLQDSFDPGKLKAMVENGNVMWDVVGATQFDSARACGTLYQKFDYSKVDISHVPEGTITDECMVPNVLSGMVLAYNTDLFGDNPPSSVADFFDTEKYPGKRTVSQSAYVEPQVLEFALAADGVSPDDLKPEDIEAAFAKYQSLGDDLIGWTTGAQSQQQLESGEAVMGLVYSGRGFAAADAGAPIAPMWDHWMMIVDSTAIPLGVKDLDAAYAAVNYYLGAEQQAKFSELSSYGAVNTNAKPDLSDTAAQWSTVENFDTGQRPNVDFWVNNYETLANAWAGWATGS